MAGERGAWSTEGDLDGTLRNLKSPRKTEGGLGELSHSPPCPLFVLFSNSTKIRKGLEPLSLTDMFLNQSLTFASYVTVD